LSELRESHKSFHRSSSAGVEAKVGDVVIIHEEFIPRHRWRLGAITKLIESKDGLIRGAEVLVGATGSKIKRPVCKLFPIEYVREENQHSDEGLQKITKPTRDCDKLHSQVRRSKREAAIMADLKRQLVEAGV
jgi:hypothetical protein